MAFSKSVKRGIVKGVARARNDQIRRGGGRGSKGNRSRR
jgi:hypothetical protein